MFSLFQCFSTSCFFLGPQPQYPDLIQLAFRSTVSFVISLHCIASRYLSFWLDESGDTRGKMIPSCQEPDAMGHKNDDPSAKS